MSESCAHTDQTKIVEWYHISQKPQFPNLLETAVYALKFSTDYELAIGSLISESSIRKYLTIWSMYLPH